MFAYLRCTFYIFQMNSGYGRDGGYWNGESSGRGEGHWNGESSGRGGGHWNGGIGGRGYWKSASVPKVRFAYLIFNMFHLFIFRKSRIGFAHNFTMKFAMNCVRSGAPMCVICCNRYVFMLSYLYFVSQVGISMPAPTTKEMSLKQIVVGMKVCYCHVFECLYCSHNSMPPSPQQSRAIMANNKVPVRNNMVAPKQTNNDQQANRIK